MTPSQRELLYVFVGRRHKALDSRATSAYVRLAHAGVCPFCQVPFGAGLEAVSDAFRHVHASPACCRALAQQVELPAWEAEQQQLRRRAKSPYARVLRRRCERCGETFLSVRQRRFCRAPLCERAGIRARKVRWLDAHPRADCRRFVVCEVCGREFQAERADARYCAPTCRQRARRHGSQERRDGVEFPIGVTRTVGRPAPSRLAF